MKKQIHIFSDGEVAASVGNPQIVRGGKQPTSIVEVDIDDATFNTWIDNPQKYKHKFKELADAHLQKKKDKRIVKEVSPVKFKKVEEQSADKAVEIKKRKVVEKREV